MLQNIVEIDQRVKLKLNILHTSKPPFQLVVRKSENSKINFKLSIICYKSSQNSTMAILFKKKNLFATNEKVKETDMILQKHMCKWDVMKTNNHHPPDKGQPVE